MTRLLIPRLSAPLALKRFAEIQEMLDAGVSPANLPGVQYPGAQPNPTGGHVARESDLRKWQAQIAERLLHLQPADKEYENRHGIVLGRALAEVVDPVPADAGHDGTWSFLSLVVFPDVVASRWPSQNGGISAHRWVGAQISRDRNYLKLAWRRWVSLGGLLEVADPPLGEDEFGSLLERSALARNRRLVQAAARCVCAYNPPTAAVKGGRSDFTRLLMKRISHQTGARFLDILGTTDLEKVVEEAASAAYRDMLVSVQP